MKAQEKINYWLGCIGLTSPGSLDYYKMYSEIIRLRREIKNNLY
jgi:hypothetical protein